LDFKFIDDIWVNIGFNNLIFLNQFFGPIDYFYI
jgi:hypothetical protein